MENQCQEQKNNIKIKKLTMLHFLINITIKYTKSEYFIKKLSKRSLFETYKDRLIILGVS